MIDQVILMFTPAQKALPENSSDFGIPLSNPCYRFFSLSINISKCFFLKSPNDNCMIWGPGSSLSQTSLACHLTGE